MNVRALRGFTLKRRVEVGWKISRAHLRVCRDKGGGVG